MLFLGLSALGLGGGLANLGLGNLGSLGALNLGNMSNVQAQAQQAAQTQLAMAFQQQIMRSKQNGQVQFIVFVLFLKKLILINVICFESI